MTTHGQPGQDWTVVLRRQPARIVQGQPQGGYTDAFELVCCHCGDDPDLDYREISPELRQIRGPYPIAAGVAAYEEHVRLYHSRTAIYETAEPISRSPDESGSKAGCPPKRERCQLR